MTVHQIRKRGAKGIVKTYGDILMSPGQSVHRWEASLVQKVRNDVAAAAPAHDAAKRPYRPHSGVPLKQSITASVKARKVKTRYGARLYSVVGSRAPYSLFVDQGTGVFAGGAPWEAKVLPPTTAGGGDLYEAGWGSGKHSKPIMIKGQKGQFFFDKGLARAYSRHNLVSSKFEGAKVGRTMAAVPASLDIPGFAPEGGYEERKAEWRRWRKENWASTRERIGTDRMAKARAETVARTNAAKDSGVRTPGQVSNARSRANAAAFQKAQAEAQAFARDLRKRFPNVTVGDAVDPRTGKKYATVTHVGSLGKKTTTVFGR